MSWATERLNSQVGFRPLSIKIDAISVRFEWQWIFQKAITKGYRHGAPGQGVPGSVPVAVEKHLTISSTMPVPVAMQLVWLQGNSPTPIKWEALSFIRGMSSAQAVIADCSLVTWQRSMNQWAFLALLTLLSIGVSESWSGITPISSLCLLLCFRRCEA